MNAISEFSSKRIAGDSYGPKNAHVIVCGNEKGGSGKTTTAMHLAIYLLKQGYKVATIDLDCRQLSLTRYVENRTNWARKTGADLPLPAHHHFSHAFTDSVAANENEELGRMSLALRKIEAIYDFVVVDTPGSDSYLMRLAHSMADTLITPLNDSFVDFDVLAKIDPISVEITDLSHYAKMVRDARRHRRMVDNGLLDWVVVRNRLSSLSSRNRLAMQSCLQDLSMQLGCRLADGISERVIFREYFPNGLTAMDDLDERIGGSQPSMSHLAARQEIRQLIKTLRLPTDEAGKRRADRRKAWLDTTVQANNIEDIFAD